MRPTIRAIMFLAISSVLFLSCTKDEEEFTNATIMLTDILNRPVKGMVVYAYSENTWSVIGENTFFAEGQSASDENGNAIFSNIEYSTCFNAINNYQNTFRFSVHYTLNNNPKMKVIAVTFKKGDSKKEIIILD